jgi:hypothetical protein
LPLLEHDIERFFAQVFSGADEKVSFLDGNLEGNEVGVSAPEAVEAGFIARLFRHALAFGIQRSAIGVWLSFHPTRCICRCELKAKQSILADLPM